MDTYQYHVVYFVRLCDGAWENDKQACDYVNNGLDKYFQTLCPTYTIGGAFYITTSKNFYDFYGEMLNKFGDLCDEAYSKFNVKDFCTFEYDICPKLPDETAIYCINREIKYFE